jgi:hypothetical protein
MLGNLQEWFSLDSAASDPDLLRQRLLPAQPEFLLSLEGSLERIAARLLCRYQGNPATVAPGAPGNSGFPIPSPSQPGVFLTRNAAAEAAAIRRLERAGFTEIIGDERILRGEGPILQFIAGDLERLKSEWSVSFGSRFAAASSKVERVAPDWKPAGSGQDWLAFDLQFVSSGGTVFDRAAIARMLATGTGHQKLPNGRTAVISLDETADFNEVLQDVQPDQHSGHFRVRKSQLDYLAQSFNSPLNISPADSWPAADSVPPTIFNILRDYQKSGVQWLLDQASASLGGILAGGNVAIVLASESAPLPAVTLAETLAVSDVPAGVVNIITARRAELLPHLVRHADIDWYDLWGCPDELLVEAEQGAAEHVARVARRPHGVKDRADAFDGERGERIDGITAFLEMKTVWHPIGS